MLIITLSALIVGCTQVVKQAGVPAKYLPLVAIILGGIINPLVIGVIDVSSVLNGIAIGLATTGIIDLVDNKLTKYTNI